MRLQVSGLEPGRGRWSKGATPVVTRCVGSLCAGGEGRSRVWALVGGEAEEGLKRLASKAAHTFPAAPQPASCPRLCSGPSGWGDGSCARPPWGSVGPMWLLTRLVRTEKPELAFLP